MKVLDFHEMLAKYKAREYFYNKKQRQAYYWGSGSMSGDFDSYNEAFMPFTDDEVSRIKSLIIDEVNSCEITPEPVSTVQEALDVLNYGDLFDHNEELRKLLLDRCEQSDLYPDEIDFDTKHYYYRFSCFAYDYAGNRVTDVIPVRLLLSDEDYLTLLSLQLRFRNEFTFNQLLKKNPELALKLNDAVEGCIYGWVFPEHVSFGILFDEVREDAAAIKPKATPEIVKEYNELQQKLNGLDPSWSDEEANAVINRVHELEDNYDMSHVK